MNLIDRLRALRNPVAQTATSISSDPDFRRQAAITGGLLNLMMAGSVLTYLVMFATTERLMVAVIASSLLVLSLIAWAFYRRGNLQVSAIILVAGLVLVINLLTLEGGGVTKVSFTANIVTILAAGLLLGGNAAVITTLVIAVIGLGMAIAEMNGFQSMVELPSEPLGVWAGSIVPFFLAAGLIYLSQQSLRESRALAAQKERQEAESRRQLEEARLHLEDQVFERTKALEQRTAYLQAIMDVTQSTASMLNDAELMRQAVELVKEQFGLYYVGLFMVDPDGEWADLRAGTGEAGRRMLERGHRIRVGLGMIGWSIANAQPRVAGEAGADYVRLVNPDLPETRSEAAIPLRSRGRVLGAMSVQSERPNAFGETEIATFQALADQVGIALDNAHLYTESQKALEAARQASGQSARRTWGDFIGSLEKLEMTYRHGAIQEDEQAQRPAQTVTTTAPTDGLARARQQVMESGEPMQFGVPQGAMLLLPIPVRDVQIGVMSFIKEGRGGSGVSPDSPKWSQDEIELLQNIVGQMGVALDSARLYQSTQRLAYREQLTGEVTARIRQTLDIQTVLQTAVNEIQRALSLPEVMISLSAPEATPVEMGTTAPTMIGSD